MPVLAAHRAHLPGLNESMILLAIENIVASIQPGNSPRITTAGVSVPYSSAVRKVRRTRAVPGSIPAADLPWVGVRRTSVSYERNPARRMYGRMNVDFVLRVQGQDLYDGDSALDALADDIVAAMFSGYGMDPADVSATVGYAHDLDYTNILYVPGEADSVQAEAVMTFEIRFLRSNGKEVGHTGYMP